MAVHAYHPETGHHLVLDTAQLDHMRQSGWVLASEWEAQQQAAAAAAAAAEDQAAPAAKTAKNA